MISRFSLISILTLVCLFVFVFPKKHKVRHGPNGMAVNDTTTCVEFAKYARFNPYSVLLARWFVFYYWGPPIPQETYVFTFPTANHTKFLHKILDGNTHLPVDWSARHILMEDHRNQTSLLVERNDRGAYWLFLLYKVTKGLKIRPRDVRFKQTGDNRLLGYMDCDKQTLLVMARINDVPPKNRLQDEAARLGFRGRRGKSYLYQGHEWMPIPEDDDKHYWKQNKPSKTSANDVKSSEQSSEEVPSEKTNEPETTEETVNNIPEKGGEIEKNIPDKTEEHNNNTSEKPEEEKNNTTEKNQENERNIPENVKNIENDDDDDEEKKYKQPHHLVTIDKNVLKEQCVEILPEPWENEENQESTKKPEIITKDYLDSVSVNVKETTEFTDVPDQPLSTNIKENKKEDIHNNQQKINERDIATDRKLTEERTKKEPPTNGPTANIKYATDKPYEPENVQTSKYVTATDQPYVPENAHTSKYLENTRFTEEPVSKSLPVSSKDPSDAKPNTTNDPSNFIN